jgi:hypothetical protein
MSIRRKKALKAIAILLTFAVAQVYIQISFAEPPSATPPVPLPQNIIIGRLTTRNNQPITVNGNSAASGASIQTGATIQTPADVGATINLGPLGSVDLAPNTTIRLDFDEQGNIKVTLITGCVIVRAKRNTEGRIDTEQGNAAKTEKKKGGILDVCFPSGASGPIVGQGAAAAAGAGVAVAGSGGAVAAGGGIGAITIGAIVAGGTIAAIAIPIALRGGGGNPSTVSGSIP